ncbi:MAG: multifunctional oxoglutarate decarboxylase/oxoglutarate dehydrogenase thiamine pyrophosphate-binding subunit/dihydrolipoyllysine-residue succinyltransferase subunit [Nitrospiraceae bacterium]|nr:multifunctional oxoglutarate decarboxylase/oxoglutarate dehydrogenase thiamine pyrophosphate-binding subunit/dihydrolipoyllysine-residue succinyltransferase subunit [Nitrospiraceae bacterium]
MAEKHIDAVNTFGPNSWLVEEYYEAYKRDPASVPESWRDFFSGYYREEVAPAKTEVPAPSEQLTPATATFVPSPVASVSAEAASATPAAPAAPVTPAAVVSKPAPAAYVAPAGAEVIAIRGAAARIVANMTASLEVPTATSIRSIPAKLLEVNRGIINNHLARSSGEKVSFTHIIAYAIVQAVKAYPVMNSVFVSSIDAKGTPGVQRSKEINVGIAVDMAKADGSRTLMVPVIRSAQEMDFFAFLREYENLIRKVRTNKVSPDDFVGATISVTNPGTIGTEHSVPRLMLGQGAIIGVGSISFPTGMAAADPSLLVDLGVSKTVTLTSTYDHRVIQGAESGLFLARIHELLTGQHGFYQEVFDALSVPYPPATWERDSAGREPGDMTRMRKQAMVNQLIDTYRSRGHLMARLDPLAQKSPAMPEELDPAWYGLTVWDLDREFYCGGLGGHTSMTLGALLQLLRDAYCRTIGMEYMFIQDPTQKEWIQRRVEGARPELDTTQKMHLLRKLNAAEAFERFLHTRYIGQKRFGLEGGEAAIVFLDQVLDRGAEAGLREAVIGMAHRGRLNVLTNIVGKSYSEIFKEFEGNLDPNSVQGSGDVKYHKGFRGVYRGYHGTDIEVTLSSNPSHLEAVDPVVEGMTRAKQDIAGERGSFRILPVLLHGDAAFAGQGVVAETLNLSQLGGYRTGGTVHLVINNQVGFTTNPEQARSSRYATDVAKMIQAPIFHVNGDDPEAVAWVAELALDYREAFHRDVVVDMVCYRRFGHNEGDEPSYTQPQMYEIIEAKRSVRKLYTESLVARGDISMDEAEQSLDDFLGQLQSALDQTRSSAPPKPTELPKAPEHNVALEAVDTHIAPSDLELIGQVLHTFPAGFTVHPKLVRQLESRREILAGGDVDWGLGEQLAFGTLALEGFDVRMAGQDSRRGTFSHRHAALIDYRTGEDYVPLEHVATFATSAGRRGPFGRFMIYDSLLSEYAALGFEYGYSTVRRDTLVIWEAQFGDFGNGGQIIIDQFIAAAHDKWDQGSGLVMLLPHGYEGQGPEHSSGRMERFLQMCAGENLAVMNLTTAGQYFHMLRAQPKRQNPRPVILFSPKSLLRSRQARVPVEVLTGGRFNPVLDDPTFSGISASRDPGEVRRVVLCSGKIAFEALGAAGQIIEGKQEGETCAVVRVEQLYPWPVEEIAAVLARYARATEVVWLQEEPENQGAWSFVHSQLHSLLRSDYRLRHVSRVPAGSPATGSAAMHALEQADLIHRAVTLKASDAASGLVF